MREKVDEFLGYIITFSLAGKHAGVYGIPGCLHDNG